MSDKFDEFEFDENLLDDDKPASAEPEQVHAQTEPAAGRSHAKPKKKAGLFSLDPQEMIARVKEAPVIYIGAAIFIFVALYMLYNVLFGWGDAQPKHQAQPQHQQHSLGLNIQNARAQHVATQPAPHKIQQQQSAVPGQPVTTTQQSVAAHSNGNFVSMTKKDMKSLLNGFAQTTAKQSADLDQRLAALQQAVAAQGKANGNLQQQVDQIAQEQSKLVSVLKNSAQDMKNISSALNQTKSQLQLLIAERAAHAEKLTLRAVVPGRAWLVNGKGRTTTVTVGMDLGSYGKVVKIDSDHDKVYMSSGYVFS